MICVWKISVVVISALIVPDIAQNIPLLAGRNTNTQLRASVLNGRPSQWNANPNLRHNVNLPRDDAFRQRLQRTGLSSSGTVRRQTQPDYRVAGGASCQAQCLNGVASGSCFCARYMCYYRGCSSNCNLIREGTTIRTQCGPSNYNPYYVAPTNNNTPKCLQSLDPGTCNSRIYTRYGYSSRSRNCVRFMYSGCGGNENRFTTRNSCLSACSR